MDLEQQLRSVLTDDRLDVPVVTGAVQAVHDGVRRRKRRNAVLSGAASVALVAVAVGGAVVVTRPAQDLVRPGGAFIPPPPTPGGIGNPGDTRPADNEIPWRAIPYDPAHPYIVPGATQDPTVPACTEGDVGITASGFESSTGTQRAVLTLTNDGDTCALQGPATVIGLSAQSKVIARSAPADGFLAHPWFKVDNGQKAKAYLTLTGDGSRCLGGVTRLGVGFGGDGTPVDVTIGSGTGVTPSCGSAPESEQLDHYVVTASDWTRPDGTPTLATGGLHATMGRLPTSVMQGQTTRYQVLLSTGGDALDQCLPFREQLVALDGTQRAYGTSYFLLDCDAINSAHDKRVVLDIELPLPKDIPVGRYALQWQTPIPGLDVHEAQQVHVTPRPPRCDNDQLELIAGRSGAATTHWQQVVILRNTSHSTCSLRGYPGITFVNDKGQELHTSDPWVLTSFTWNLPYYETLRLDPGTDVSFALGGVDYDTVHQKPCPSAAGVKVIPPNGSQQLAVSLKWPYCQNGQVDVSPLVSGAAGPS